MARTRNGRPALINRPDIKHPDHLDLLDAVEQTLVSYRWGIATGQPLTQAETADAMNTTRETVRRVEAGAAQKIIDYLQSPPRTTRTDPDMLGRVMALEAIVAEYRVDLERLTARLDALEVSTIVDEIGAITVDDVRSAKSSRRRLFRRHG